MRIAFVTAAALLIASCYYESPHALTTPERASLDDALIGTWKEADAHVKDVYRVRAFDEHTYVVESQSDGERTLLRAFVAEVGPARFLNVQELKPSATNYVFFRYHWAADTLVLRGIKEQAPPPLASAGVLRRWVAQHLNGPIYEEPVKLIRETN